MAEPLTKKTIEKIYKGALNYLQNGSLYAEETFEVFRDNKEFSLNYISQMVSRVSTGELLKISVDYTVNKDWTPIRVIIKRILGPRESEEKYEYNVKSNHISYSFKAGATNQTFSLSTPPKFFISAPSGVTASLFVKSKKIDNTADNYYTFYMSENVWEFNGPPQPKSVILIKPSTTVDEIMVEGKSLQATSYKIYEEDDFDEKAEGERVTRFVTLYVSKHVNIPYKVESSDGNIVQIKFLNNLDENA